MSHRAFRFLLCWFVVALQAMTPFIHAHAGAVHLGHSGFLHLHQHVVHADTSWHTLAADEHGAEVAVATGLPMRSGIHVLSDDVPTVAMPTGFLPVAAVIHSNADFLAPPQWLQALPAHTLPFALAPPAV